MTIPSQRDIIIEMLICGENHIFAAAILDKELFQMSKLFGNAIVGQSGGPTAAINATLSGIIRGALASESIEKIYGAKNGIEGMLRGDAVDLTGFFSDNTEEKLTLLEKTPAAALGSCRKKLPDPLDPSSSGTYEKLIDFFRLLNIRYFCYIG